MIAVLCLVQHGIACAQAGGTGTLTGSWISSDHGRPHARIDITERNGEFRGRIVAFYPAPGEEANPRCEDCAGANRDQPIVGMDILWGLRRQDGHDVRYEGGQVLDPDSGKVYHCRVTLSADGATLTLRAWIGAPLFGETEIWRRAP